jgi:hypothetical protein
MRLTDKISLNGRRLAAASCLFLLFSMVMVWKQYRIVVCSQIIVKLEKAAAGQNEQLYQRQFQLQGLSDRKRVEEIAAKEFGLVYPQAGDVVYVEKMPPRKTVLPKSLDKFFASLSAQ